MELNLKGPRGRGGGGLGEGVRDVHRAMTTVSGLLGVVRKKVVFVSFKNYFFKEFNSNSIQISETRKKLRRD